VKDDISELWDLILAYLRQETWEPTRALGRYALFGVAGSALLACSASLFVLGVLRLLQQEAGSAFQHSLSWVPYLVSLVVVIVVAGASAAGVLRVRRQESAYRPGEGR
jgi:ABC-type uncharacterized transport system permease subunit